MRTNAFTFDDVLLVPAYNHHASRRLVSLRMSDKTNKLTLELPVMTAGMDTITEHRMANFINQKGGIGVLHRFMSTDENVAEFEKCQGSTFVSVGCSEKEMLRAQALRDAGAEYFSLDVAHSHARYVGRALRSLREMAPNACIMAGNVATYAGADYLAAHGADIIKAGIGGGSVCTTRIKTGFGVPMLTCIQECARVDRSVVADGGIRTSGDVVKALAFGADFVMLGGMFAGCTHTPGKAKKNDKGQWVKEYRGMASKEVQDDFLGGMPEWKTAEGVVTEVKSRTDDDLIVADLIGGLRSGLTYGGAENIQQLQRKLEYMIVSHASKIESLPHKTL